MKLRHLALTVGLLLPFGTSAGEPLGELRVGIQEPADGRLFTGLDRSVRVEGGASIFGGVEQLDLFLLLDTSKSLEKKDPRDHRVAGAIALVRQLPAKSDIQIGVVDFDGNTELVMPLTKDRNAVVAALRKLDRHGSTDLAAGIAATLDGFDAGARPGSSRVMLLFTDGKSDEEEALAAAADARSRGVAIHTLLLAKNPSGEEMLRAIAKTTAGSFLRVRDPRKLPEAFVELRTTGIERVTLRANQGPELSATLAGGSFSGELPLVPGTNQLTATATSLEGETRSTSVTVTVSDQLDISIDSPLDGTLYTEQREQVEVSGTATLFAGADPAQLAEHPDQGIRKVLLRVGDSPPFATALSGGRFQGSVLLSEGENRILATATALDGRAADAVAYVTVRPPGCAELEVQAFRSGEPALSISERAVTLVVDASNSMWAQIDGRARMDIAKEILGDALEWLPPDLGLGLRVYGHQHAREKRDCKDSALMVPLGSESRASIRDAIAAFKPRGQTPLGYSIEQVANDFGEFTGERAVVLLTDGVESCGGDPVAAARALQANGPIPVHVIGFALAEDADGSLRAIAEASGGRFIAASNAEELRAALVGTVGTPFRVTRAGSIVAEGALGDGSSLTLPAGHYAVEVASRPSREFAVELLPEQAATLVLDQRGTDVSPQTRQRETQYRACPAAALPAARAPTPSE